MYSTVSSMKMKAWMRPMNMSNSFQTTSGAQSRNAGMAAMKRIVADKVESLLGGLHAGVEPVSGEVRGQPFRNALMLPTPARRPRPKLLVGGRLVDPAEGGTLTITNPATGARVAEVPAAGARDVDLAVKAARRAFEDGPWPKMSARERGKRIRRLAELVWEKREELALVESLENGKTFREAIRGEQNASFYSAKQRDGTGPLEAEAA